MTIKKPKPDRHKVNAMPVFLPWYLSEHLFSYFHKLCENFTVERKVYTVDYTVPRHCFPLQVACQKWVVENINLFYNLLQAIHPSKVLEEARSG